jgi:hypothetical protein
MYVFNAAVNKKKPLLKFSNSSYAHVNTSPHSSGELEDEIYLTR